MSEEKNVLEEVVAALKKLLGFGTDEQITSAVNGIVDAKGDEAGVVAALQGLFGDALPKADLLSVVKDFLGKGNGIDLGNIMNLFQGIGDKFGGFDKIAGLVGALPGADKAADAAGAVKDADADAAGAVKDAATDAAGATKAAAGSVTRAVKDATVESKLTANKPPSVVVKADERAKQVAAEPAKKRKKWPIVVGVLAAVVALAGVGMWIWHEQPSFCASFCHYSMDAYLESYDQEDNVAGVDKYGNDVANTHAMLAVSHKAAKDMTCLSCHIPAIDQQIGEVMMTITGDYTVYERVNGNGTALKEVPLASLQEDAHLVNDSGVGDEFCLRSGCHDFTREVLTKVEMPGMTKNPHMWLNQAHMNVEFACGDCHKSHRASVNACTQCHDDAAEGMPDGWLTYQEGQAANIAA